MSEKITAMIEEIKTLTVLELSELVHALEEEFGVSAAAMAAPAAAAAPAAKEDEYRESLTDTIPKGTRLGDYLKSRNLTLDEFKRDNQSAMASFQKNGEDELDSIATESTYVFIPAQK